MKRIALFLATNLAIVLVLSVTMRLLGVEPHLTAQGLDLDSLLVFAAVTGFGGSFVSLALSKWTAKRALGVHIIDAPAGVPRRPWGAHPAGRAAMIAALQTADGGSR